MTVIDESVAAVPREVTEVIPRTLERCRIEEGSDEWFDRRYAALGDDFVRLNLITTITGATAGADGTSDSITSRTDRYVLGAIRRAADVVVVGAQTVRAEGYLLPRTARLAIVTSTGDLGVDGLSDAGRESRPPALVLCPASREDAVRKAVSGVRAEVVPVSTDSDRLEPAPILGTLHRRGLTRVVCEGGPTLATQFAESGVVDEICVTVSPRLEPTGTPFLNPRARIDAEVVGLLVDEAGFSYLRLRPRG